MTALASTAAAQTTTPFGDFAQESFSDVDASHPNYEAIESLRENNILRGYPDGTFKPDSRINRAEFVYLMTNPLLLDTERLSRCIDEMEEKDKAKGYVYFTDVSPNVWYAHAVCHAAKKDIINGYPDHTFQPGGNINFVETAKILANVFSLNTNEQEGERWFDPYVESLSELNVIPPTVTKYGELMTRGEMAEMLYRLRSDVSDRPATHSLSF